MLCPHCGQEHPDSTRFCTITGKTIKQPTIICPNCGRELPAGIIFCTSCGKHLDMENIPVVKVVEEEKKSTSITCPKCGAHHAADTKFCTVCGQPLTGEAAPPPASITEEGTITCPHCATKLPGGTKFCTTCGKPIDVQAIPSAAPETQEGTITCPHCATKLPGGTKFCTTCGQTIDGQTTAPPSPETSLDTITCPHCDAQLPRGTKVCTSCGREIKSKTTREKASKAKKTPVPIVAESEGMIICPHCASQQSPGTKFCTVCGSALEQGTGEVSVLESGTKDIDTSSATEQEQETKKINCPYCGAQLPASSRFCTTCGMFLTEEMIPSHAQTKKTTELEAGIESDFAISDEQMPSASTVAPSMVPAVYKPLVASDEEITCPYCKYILPADTVICPSCATVLKADVDISSLPLAEEANVLCPYCGLSLPESVEVCPSCATNLHTGKISPVQPNVNGAITICEYCSLISRSGASECTSCGAPLNPPPPQEIIATKPVDQIQCLECGSDVPQGMQYCPKCGAAVPLVAEETPGAFCTECGTAIPGGMEFCPNCGAAAGGTAASERTEKKIVIQSEEKSGAFCTECGTAIPTGMEFCPNCGAAVGGTSGDKTEKKTVAAAEEKPGAFCTECGTAIPTGMEFCPNCGAAVIDHATSDTDTGAQTEEEPAVAVEEKPGAFCTECGTAIPEGMEFCPNCSTPIEGSSGEIVASPSPDISGETTLCSNCQADVPIDMKFCPVCGASMINKQALDIEASKSMEDEIIAAIIRESKTEKTEKIRDEESISPPSKPAHPCPNCGAALPLAAKICEACGASVFTEPTKQLCQNCWQEIPSGVAFCINCGAPIPIPEGVTPLPLPPQGKSDLSDVDIKDILAETNPIEDQPNATTSVKEILFEKDIAHNGGARNKKRESCPRCGILLTPGMKFCASCGMSLVPGLEEVSEHETVSETEACPFCRIIIPKGRLVCPSCGNALEANVDIEKVADNGGPQTNRCPFCGLKIPVSAKICPSCAAVISNTTPDKNNAVSSPPSGQVVPPPPDTAPPPLEKQISPSAGSKPESDKPRPFPGPTTTVRNKPPVKQVDKNGQLLSKIAAGVKLSKTMRLTMLIAGGIILLSAAGFTAFQLFTPYKPKSLEAQLTQIAETAQPIATLPAALALDSTATEPVAEQALASPTPKAKKTIQATPTLEPELSATVALTGECSSPDDNGVCPPALSQTEVSPLASPSAATESPSQNPTADSAQNSTTAIPDGASPTLQPNANPGTTTAAALPTIPANLSTQTNKADAAAMVQIPAGEFIMGSESKSDPDYWGVEGPPHIVRLDSYWIYKTEVTNAMYQKCVEAGTCTKPSKADTSSSYYSKSQYADYPVVQVNWEQAQTYCNWAGGSLPSEAQWEKAARGTDARRFPWGNAQPDGKKLNLCDKNCSLKEKDDHQDDGYMSMAPVGSFPDGMSPYGLLDMAGNVWEWTADWYQASYYKTSPLENPTGPQEGTGRTIRGGSWSDKAAAQFRTVVRQGISPISVFDTLGFRCVVP